MTDSVLLPPVVETNTNFATLLGTIDLGSDAKTILLAMVNRSSVKQFTFDEYAFSDPVRPTEQAPVRNTLIRLLPKSGSNLYGSVTLYYNRMNISAIGDIKVYKNGATLISEVIPYINTTYGIYLSPTDYIDGPLPSGSDVEPVSVTLNISPTCIQFYGGTPIVTALPQTIQVDKAHIGLTNVDNTSDAAKPVSTAQAQADANTLLAAHQYTDNKSAAFLSDAAIAATNKDTIVLTAAKDYTDTTAALLVNSTNVSIAAALNDATLGAVVLAQADAAAQGRDTAVLTASNAFTTTAINNVKLLSTQDIATAKAETIATLNASIATSVAALTTAFGNADAQVLASARTYSNTADAALLVTANNFATSADVTNLTAAKAYADTKAAEAVTTAQTATNVALAAAVAADATLVTTLQPKLVSGTNIKTINGVSLLGSTDIIVAPLVDVRKITYTYDGSGRNDTTVEETDQGLRTTTFTFNADNSINTKIIVFGSVTKTHTYTYNVSGKVTQVVIS